MIHMNAGFSVCEFGSYARGQHDDLSDKDALVISSCYERVVDVVEEYESNGWSVAYYTWNRLNKLADYGSLFIQHLKQDGKIVYDNQNSLYKLLTEFSPKNSYQRELVDSMNITSALGRRINSIDLAMCQSDIIYVWLRNAMILSSASDGVFEFQYDKLAKAFSEQKGKGTEGYEVLIKLRNLKHQYRSREIDLDVESYMKQALQLGCEAFNVEVPDFEALRPAKKSESNYCTVRDIESLLVARFGLTTLEVIPAQSEIGEIWSFVQNPREYSWFIKNLDESYISKVNAAVFS